jgi:hypothetical protein
MMRLIAIISLLLAEVLTSQLLATPIPQNLGNGLRAIIEKHSFPRTATQPSIFDYERLMITDAQNRVLVNIMLNGTVSLNTMKSRTTALGANVTATDAHYRAGVIEAFVSLSQAVDIAKMEGVSAVNLVPKPVTNIGEATTQGIVQHRIDKLPTGINGAGTTVGVLSDSYNTSFGSIRAGDDVASGDLPGPANPFGHTQHVVVLQDEPFGSDEGRAMLQIVHDIAPEARLGFATAFAGEVEFGDNIRSLAGFPSGSLSRPNFKADVIIDDVIYFDEPMFQDGIVAQAVDDVAAAGVSYFSSAGNQPASQAYDAQFRLVPNSAAAAVGTNLNFRNVDPALFKGGFHNFAPTGGQDIAQNIHIDGFAIISFQWNEPFDSTPPTLGRVLQSGSGTLTDAMPTKDFPFAGTAGQQIGIIADADPGSPNPLPDVTITLIDPHGNEIAFQDRTTNPETLISFLPITGTYTIRIGGFLDATGDFVYDVREASGTLLVQSDFNLLFFDTKGRFLGAVAENNRVTNRPIELGVLFGTFDVQMVISRANKPPQGVPAADHLRYVFFDGGFPKEFVSYTTPSTYGHNSAAGANGVGAYAFYPPFVPESFTSSGPVTIYFDRNNNRLPEPDRRLKPDMAAMDGANTTFFVADATEDPDSLPNFFGTSAAAPHAGGIAALMLQAAGGPHSLLPDDVRQAMQASAFLHDLDPSYSQGVANQGGDLVFASGDGDGGNTSSADPNFFKVTYSGGSSLTSLKLNPTEANPTETPTQGLVFDTRVSLGLPFTLGNLTGVSRLAIAAAFSVPAPPPAVAGQFRQLTVSINPGAMTGGDAIRFGVDRDEADNFGPGGGFGGNSADLLGSGVLIPQGTVVPGGATFSATLENGKVLQGIFVNTIGNGYSSLDGFGFVNAETAVKAVQKP